MRDDADSITDDADSITVERKWLRFGVLLAVLHLAFLAVLLVLLQWSVPAAIGFAVVASVVGAAFVYAVSFRL